MMRNHFGTIRLANFFPAFRRATLAAALLSLAVPAAAVINTGTDAEAGPLFTKEMTHLN